MRNNKKTIIQFDQLKALIENILIGYSLPVEQAKIGADVIVSADLRGVHSHGCSRIISLYKQLIKAKHVRLDTSPIKAQRDSVVTFIDAMHGFGPYVSYEAMLNCINSATNEGVGIVAVTNNTNFGMASYYSLMAAMKNFIGIVVTNGSPAVAPPGGLRPIIGTNALSVAFPYTTNQPIVFDIGMSSTSLGNLYLAMCKGENVPGKWCASSLLKKLELEPEEKIDPRIIFDNRMVAPLGGGDLKGEYKGFQLSLLLDMFISVLFAGSFSFEQKKGCSDNLFIALNPTKYLSEYQYESRLKLLLEQLGNYEVDESFEKLRIPGERANRLHRERITNGIPIESELLEMLLDEARKLKIPTGFLRSNKGVKFLTTLLLAAILDISQTKKLDLASVFSLMSERII